MARPDMLGSMAHRGLHEQVGVGLREPAGNPRPRPGATAARAALVIALLLTVPAGAAGFSARLPAPAAGLAAAPAPAPAPQLGKSHSSAQRGFGRVRPTEVFLGGDPTGLVQHIHWSGWGSSQAVGAGEAEYDWPGTAVAANPISPGARIVAFHLGTCHGQRSYNALEWYFPKYGQVFNPHQYIDTCTGAPVGAIHVIPCANVRLADGAGTATLVNAIALSCASARTLIAEVPVAQYLSSGGRFVQSGFRCGTEGNRGGGSAIFSCQLGIRELSFTVE